MKRYFRIEVIVIFFIAVYWTFHVFEYQKWNNKQAKDRIITYDAVSYYAYLPAIFIHNDLTFSFIDEIDLNSDLHRYDLVTLKNGNKLVKMTMGLSILYLPFFLLGHTWALFSDYAVTGFSKPYEIAIALSTVIYALLGIIILSRILRKHFSGFITSMTLLVIGIGTNLFTYLTFKSPMVHAYNFFMLTTFLYGFQKFYKNPKLLYAALLGLLGGLIILTRPTNLIPVAMIVLFYGVYSKATLQEKIYFFKSHAKPLLVGIVCCIAVGLPQLFYWKAMSGSWLFFSYKGESFFWGRPMIPQILFSYRNGWLIYTPVMFFAIAGFFRLKGQLKKYLVINVASTVFLLYVFSCWWTWWFGGGHGFRPMIDMYGILALPMAAAFQKISENGRLFKIILAGVLVFFVHLNLFQHNQYKRALLHWDSMTEEAYWEIFLDNRWPKTYPEILDSPDYEKSLEGGIDLPGEADKSQK